MCVRKHVGKLDTGVEPVSPGLQPGAFPLDQTSYFSMKSARARDEG